MGGTTYTIDSKEALKLLDNPKELRELIEQEVYERLLAMSKDYKVITTPVDDGRIQGDRDELMKRVWRMSLRQ